MRTMTKTLGWLVVAAALTFGFSACSSDDDAVAEKPTVPTGAVSTVHVSVGAGISGEGTRSAVDAVYNDQTGKTSRTLQFSAGSGEKGEEGYVPADRLFIIGELSEGETHKYLTGYLDMDVTSLSADGSQATFSGELTVYDNDGNKTSYDFKGKDPLAVCKDNGGVMAHLISGSFVEDFLIIYYNYSLDYSFDRSIATGNEDNVSTLMTTALPVRSETYSTENGFTDFYGYPILNCNISGLEDSEDDDDDEDDEVTYCHIKLLYSWSSNYYNDDEWEEFDHKSEVPIDGNGTISFATSLNMGNDALFYDNRYYKLRISKDDLIYQIPLGQKTFEFGKVYNVTRTALLRKEIAENVFIYYSKGETWENAIENHSENSWFRTDDYDLVRYQDKYVCYNYGEFVYNSNPINNDDTYKLSDVGPSN